MRDLERRWSRFIADSELSQLNAHAGAPVFVSAETFDLVALAVDAWRATRGYFDPTMLEALMSSGYDRSFEELGGDDVVSSVPVAASIASLDDISLDPRARIIQTPPGVAFDLGGIGKGRAVDLVFEEIQAVGVDGVCVEFGGDLRVGGAPVAGGGWPVIVDDPFRPDSDLMTLGIGEGSVTTSSRLRRSWTTATGISHHLLDPRTLRPSESGVASVTVVSSSAAWGEVHAKAALIAGASEGRRILDEAGLAALLIEDNGTLTMVGEFERFVVDGPTLGP